MLRLRRGAHSFRFVCADRLNPSRSRASTRDQMLVPSFEFLEVGLAQLDVNGFGDCIVTVDFLSVD